MELQNASDLTGHTVQGDLASCQAANTVLLAKVAKLEQTIKELGLDRLSGPLTVEEGHAHGDVPEATGASISSSLARPQLEDSVSSNTIGATKSMQDKVLLQVPPVLYADTSAPVYAVVYGSKALQTICAKWETQIIISLIFSFEGLSGIYLVMTYAGAIENQHYSSCPHVATNFWLWLSMLRTITCMGSLICMFYWLVVRRTRGAVWHYAVAPFVCARGIGYIMFVLWGAILLIVSAAADDGLAPPCFCLEAAPGGLGAPDMVGWTLLGASCIYMGWQGTRKGGSQTRGFWVGWIGLVLAHALYFFTARLYTGDNPGMLLVVTGFCVPLPLWMGSLVYRRRRSQRRQAKILLRNRHLYDDAWSKHSDDKASIFRLETTCNQLTRGITEALAQFTTVGSGTSATVFKPRHVDTSGKDITPLLDRVILFNRAEEYAPLFKKHLQRLLVGIPNATLTMAPVKTVERTYQKAIRSYNGDFSLVTDLVRCSVLFDSLAELADGLARLDADPQTVIMQTKNRFDPNYNDWTQSGYKDIKLVAHVKGVTNGFLCEIQLHLKDIVAAKSTTGHRAYTAARDALGT